MKEPSEGSSSTALSDSVHELTPLVQRNGHPRDISAADQGARNFTRFSFIFAANPCAALACMSLATARLGKVGAFSSVMLYFTYTLSSVMGATYVVKELGGRNAMILGMSLFCCYVSCFWIAACYPEIAAVSAASGAFIGGIGAGILWTAQGSYFSSASEEHALNLGCEWTECTSSLSGTFAFAYLIEETCLHVSSYFLLDWGVPWTTIFAIYSIIAVLSVVLMFTVKNYPPSQKIGINASESKYYSATAAFNLLLRDRKMKFLVGLSAAFGFAGSFLNSFVSGEVIAIALGDSESKTVGLFVSWTAAVAAFSSLVFGKISHDYGKAPVMIFGYTAFSLVAMPFVIRPDLSTWTWKLLLVVYACQGIGRATFESTVKATFADLYPYEKEGAFANIILQNGLCGAFGYALSFILMCTTEGSYCIKYTNGTLHDVLTFELVVCSSAIIAVLGYLHAMSIQEEEENGRIGDSKIKKYHMDSVNAFRKTRETDASKC